MDTAKLGKNLLWIGIAMLAIAVVWWLIAFSDIPREIGGATGSLVKCIAGLGFECSVANAITGYSPAIFWIGLILAIAGFVVRRSAKTS